MTKVVVTGIGLVTPAGIGWEKVWANILKGDTFFDLIRAFDASACRSQIAAEILDWQPDTIFHGPDYSRYERATQFAIVATHLAMKDSLLDLDTLDLTKVSVYMGSGLGGLLFTESQFNKLFKLGPRAVHPQTIPRSTPNGISSEIAIYWKLRGENVTVSTACAAGAQAITQGLLNLKTNRCDVAIVGGAEAPIFPLAFSAFDALHVLSRRNEDPRGASRPFDKARDGFVIGEGAGILILEREETARKRGAKIYAEIAGYGSNNGSYHMVMPDPSGEDAVRAMRKAIADANASPDEIGYINAHGTGTVANDIAETKAIKEVFGSAAYGVSVSSTKSMIGHLLGAGGAVEAGITALAIYHGVVPPTANYSERDELCDLDYVPNHSREKKLHTALSNSFAFGNSNVSLLLRAV